MHENTLLRIEQLLNYRFSNPNLVAEAFTHSSQAHNRLASNERLEFLGDAILSLVICETLFAAFPEYLEGDLTKIKSMLVSRKVCSKLANDMGLQNFTQVGKGMAKTKAMSGSIAAGTLEAVVAAIYLDGGFSAAAEFILKLFGPMIETADAEQHQNNFKSILQQYCQQRFTGTPTYDLLDEKGPDHNKCFEIAVIVGRKRFQSAWGVTKKDAEQKAAYNALVDMGLIIPEETQTA